MIRGQAFSALCGHVPAANRRIGNRQLYTVAMVDPANDGPITKVVATDGAVLLDWVIIYATGANTDLTSVAFKIGPAGGVVHTLIDTTVGAQANLDAAGKQIAWRYPGDEVAGNSGYLADTDIGEVTFAGTDVTPVTQTLAVLYYALANGAYLAAS